MRRRPGQAPPLTRLATQGKCTGACKTHCHGGTTATATPECLAASSNPCTHAHTQQYSQMPHTAVCSRRRTCSSTTPPLLLLHTRQRARRHTHHTMQGDTPVEPSHTEGRCTWARGHVLHCAMMAGGSRCDTCTRCGLHLLTDSVTGGVVYSASASQHSRIQTTDHPVRWKERHTHTHTNTHGAAPLVAPGGPDGGQAGTHAKTQSGAHTPIPLTHECTCEAEATQHVMLHSCCIHDMHCERLTVSKCLWTGRSRPLQARQSSTRPLSCQAPACWRSQE